MKSMFLNFSFLLFPISCYFLYLVYSKVVNKKENNLFLDLALITGFYLTQKYNVSLHNSILIINIILLIGFHEKRYLLCLLLSFLIPVSLSTVFNINVVYLIIFYLFIFIVTYFSKIPNILVFMISSLIFIFISMFFKNINILLLITMLLVLLLTYLLIIKIYDNIKNIVNMHNEHYKILKEKMLYQSLFKITHEIKNPLAVCKGYLDMFDINDNKKSIKYISIINEEINRTLMLLNDFSNFSKLKITKEIIDIELLLEDVCDEMKMLFNNKIKFKIDLTGKEVYIYADYDRLKQVLINIFKNAVESCNNDAKITVTSKIKGENYYIKITDNGIGMDSDTLKNIGKPFYTTKKNGTGLGVCLSKEIINAHGGSIKYYSKKNQGTTLKILLPIN